MPGWQRDYLPSATSTTREVCAASAPGFPGAFILSRCAHRGASSRRLAGCRDRRGEARGQSPLIARTHARTYTRTTNSTFLHEGLTNTSYCCCCCCCRCCSCCCSPLRAGRDASRRALAFRGLRALKFAAGLRQTFPFFRLFRPAAACNTGTAALSHPVTRQQRARSLTCVSPEPSARARARVSERRLNTRVREPDGIDGFPALKLTDLLL